MRGGSGGEGGIRTHGGFAPTPDFESGTFDHSATSPVRTIGEPIAGVTALRPTLVKLIMLAETVIDWLRAQNLAASKADTVKIAMRQSLGDLYPAA